jgi:hypothetical protein
MKIISMKNSRWSVLLFLGAGSLFSQTLWAQSSPGTNPQNTIKNNPMIAKSTKAASITDQTQDDAPHENSESETNEDSATTASSSTKTQPTVVLKPAKKKTHSLPPAGTYEVDLAKLAQTLSPLSLSEATDRIIDTKSPATQMKWADIHANWKKCASLKDKSLRTSP